MRQGIIFNLLFIPWFLAPEFSLILCLPLILMGTYFLIGLELIAEDIEDPFGWDGDDLPLDTICGSIRSSITDILSLHKALKYTRSAERAIPDPLKH
jgi:putative membrane protein